MDNQRGTLKENGALQRPQGVAEKRLEQMSCALSGIRRLLILTHDNPDPDAIASGWALMRVIRKLRKIRVDLAYGGIIGRGENRTLLEELKVPLKPIDAVDLGSYQGFALVDSQPETGNNSLPAGTLPTIVIDHHPIRRRTREVPFYDVREEYGATVTILSEYLLASEAAVDRHLATALFYAIKAETQNLGREASRADVRTFLHYFPRVDNVALSRIENPPIPRDYFLMIDQAIDGTRLHGGTAVTRLTEVTNPDVVAEFADLMIRVEGIRWALAIGRYHGDILLSIRTNRTGANAGRVIQRIVGAEGTAGGHGMMAGGKIEGGARMPEDAQRIEELLLARTVQILRSPAQGMPLVGEAERRTS